MVMEIITKIVEIDVAEWRYVVVTLGFLELGDVLVFGASRTGLFVGDVVSANDEGKLVLVVNTIPSASTCKQIYQVRLKFQGKIVL